MLTSSSSNQEEETLLTLSAGETVTITEDETVESLPFEIDKFQNQGQRRSSLAKTRNSKNDVVDDHSRNSWISSCIKSMTRKRPRERAATTFENYDGSSQLDMSEEESSFTAFSMPLATPSRWKGRASWFLLTIVLGFTFLMVAFCDTVTTQELHRARLRQTVPGRSSFLTSSPPDVFVWRKRSRRMTRRGLRGNSRTRQGDPRSNCSDDENHAAAPAKQQSQGACFSSLSDVWFCLACAFGWAIWLVSNLMRPAAADWKRYATLDAVVVKGNVLQATVNTDKAIPTYHAVIDYHVVVPASPVATAVTSPAVVACGGSATYGEKVQVRKSFKTKHMLTVGFTNVDLLVLPQDPKSGILKKDWEEDHMAQQIMTHKSRASSAGGNTGGVNRTPKHHFDFSMAAQNTENNHDDDNDDDDDDDSQRSRTRKREFWGKWGIILGAGAILISIAGAVHSVMLLSQYDRSKGWWSVGMALILMGPLALLLCLFGRFCYERAGRGSLSNGIIIKRKPVLLMKKTTNSLSGGVDPDASFTMATVKGGCGGGADNYLSGCGNVAVGACGDLPEAAYEILNVASSGATAGGLGAGADPYGHPQNTLVVVPESSRPHSRNSNGAMDRYFVIDMEPSGSLGSVSSLSMSTR